VVPVVVQGKEGGYSPDNGEKSNKESYYHLTNFLLAYLIFDMMFPRPLISIDVYPLLQSNIIDAQANNRVTMIIYSLIVLLS